MNRHRYRAADSGCRRRSADPGVRECVRCSSPGPGTAYFLGQRRTLPQQLDETLGFFRAPGGRLGVYRIRVLEQKVGAHGGGLHRVAVAAQRHLAGDEAVGRLEISLEIGLVRLEEETRVDQLGPARGDHVPELVLKPGVRSEEHTSELQ